MKQFSEANLRDLIIKCTEKTKLMKILNYESDLLLYDKAECIYKSI